jgi:single-strand DNA-binding protein
MATNINNLSIFTGRITKDIESKTIGQGNEAFTQVLFTVAVDRQLTKKQKQDKQNGKDIITADYVPCKATGSTADFINKYFCKGKPIVFTASYETYVGHDQQGNKRYGAIFKVDQVGFTLKDTTNKSNDGNGGNTGNNNYQGKINEGINDKNTQKDEYLISDEECPF